MPTWGLLLVKHLNSPTRSCNHLIESCCFQIQCSCVCTRLYKSPGILIAPFCVDHHVTTRHKPVNLLFLGTGVYLCSSQLLSASHRTAVCLFKKTKKQTKTQPCTLCSSRSTQLKVQPPCFWFKATSRVQSAAAVSLYPCWAKGSQMRELHAARPSSVVQDTHPAYPLIMCYQSWDPLLLLCFSSRSPVFLECSISTF